ncbi:hypothetical protein IAT38_008004 [Cryptococcus sp. DSM 104549]
MPPFGPTLSESSEKDASPPASFTTARDELETSPSSSTQSTDKATGTTKSAFAEWESLQTGWEYEKAQSELNFTRGSLQQNALIEAFQLDNPTSTTNPDSSLILLHRLEPIPPPLERVKDVEEVNKLRYGTDLADYTVYDPLAGHSSDPTGKGCTACSENRWFEAKSGRMLVNYLARTGNDEQRVEGQTALVGLQHMMSLDADEERKVYHPQSAEGTAYAGLGDIKVKEGEMSDERKMDAAQRRFKWEAAKAGRDKVRSWNTTEEAEKVRTHASKLTECETCMPLVESMAAVQEETFSNFVWDEKFLRLPKMMEAMMKDEVLSYDGESTGPMVDRFQAQELSWVESLGQRTFRYLISHHPSEMGVEE